MTHAVTHTVTQLTHTGLTLTHTHSHSLTLTHTAPAAGGVLPEAGAGLLQQPSGRLGAHRRVCGAPRQRHDHLLALGTSDDGEVGPCRGHGDGGELWRKDDRLDLLQTYMMVKETEENSLF